MGCYGAFGVSDNPKPELLAILFGLFFTNQTRPNTYNKENDSTNQIKHDKTYIVRCWHSLIYAKNISKLNIYI